MRTIAYGAIALIIPAGEDPSTIADKARFTLESNSGIACRDMGELSAKR